MTLADRFTKQVQPALTMCRSPIFYFYDPDFGMSVNMAPDMAVVC